MKRRDLLVVLAAITVAPGTGLTKTPKIPRVGVLTPAGSEQTPIFDAFRLGLRKLGYVEGRNIKLEFRLAHGDYLAFPQMAAELVNLPVDVIVTDGGPTVAHAALKATKTIPIVMATTGVDPVVTGLVPSLAHPGGNATGFTLMHAELNAKRLELLRTAFPKVRAVAVFFYAANPGREFYLNPVQDAARQMGLIIYSLIGVDSESALAGLNPDVFSGADAVLVLPDALFWNRRREIIALITDARIPALYPEREYADDGGLMAYGANVPDIFHRAAEYVDRILKGTNPGDLPIQEPSKFDFIVNMKTAKALGMTMPQSILVRADEVIE